MRRVDRTATAPLLAFLIASAVVVAVRATEPSSRQPQPQQLAPSSRIQTQQQQRPPSPPRRQAQQQQQQQQRASQPPPPQRQQQQQQPASPPHPPTPPSPNPPPHPQPQPNPNGGVDDGNNGPHTPTHPPLSTSTPLPPTTTRRPLLGGNNGVGGQWRTALPSGCRFPTNALAPVVKPGSKQLYVVANCGANSALLTFDADAGSLLSQAPLNGVVSATGEPYFTPSGYFMFTAHDADQSPIVVTVAPGDGASRTVWQVTPEAAKGDFTDVTYLGERAYVQVNNGNLYIVLANDPAKAARKIPTNSITHSGTDGTHFATIFAGFGRVLDPETGYSLPGSSGFTVANLGKVVSRLSFGNKKSVFAFATFDNSPIRGVQLFMVTMNGPKFTSVSNFSVATTAMPTRCVPLGWGEPLTTPRVEVIFSPDDSAVYMICLGIAAAFNTANRQLLWSTPIVGGAYQARLLPSGNIVFRGSGVHVLRANDGTPKAVDAGARYGSDDVSPFAVMGASVVACSTSGDSSSWCARVPAQ